MAKISFLEALEGAGAEELEQIGKQISSREKELDALRAAYRLLDLKINGKKQRKQKVVRGSVQGSGTEDTEMTRRRRLAAKILLAKGPQHRVNLSSLTSIKNAGPGNLGLVMDHDWFLINSDNVVSLTPKGERENR